MKYYHGSSNGQLTKLTTEKSNDGYVYLAEDYCFAVLYAGCPLRFWKVDETGKLVILEPQEKAFELMYKNKPCYVYSTENIPEFERADHQGRKSIRTKQDVILTEKEYIPDAYEKILELERQGRLKLRRWEDLSEEQQSKNRERTISKMKPVMQRERDEFPYEYQLLTTMFPELKL